MSQILKKVENALKWKKSTSYCADRLNISVADFLNYKKAIKSTQNKKHIQNGKVNASHMNLDKGEGKIEGISSTEPKSPEEIIKILKIDTTQWKLSQYWNKQMSDHWRVSALISKIKKEDKDLLKELVETWTPKQFKLPANTQVNKQDDNVAAVMSLQDIHFGKEGNDNVAEDFKNGIIHLVQSSIKNHYLKKIFFVVGGDLLNMDTFAGTTTSGTPLDNCKKATDTYAETFDSMYWAINYMKSFCDELCIVYLPGNHDRLSSFHLAHALSKSVTGPDIIWDVEYAERKVHVWGQNFFAFEHGDVNTKNSILLYSTEFPQAWGSTTYRTLFTGHLHHKKKFEYITINETIGFTLKILPSLSKSDYYHYHNKYVGTIRSGIIELHDFTKGLKAELHYVP